MWIEIADQGSVAPGTSIDCILGAIGAPVSTKSIRSAIAWFM
jgi:hypothetical protein